MRPTARDPELPVAPSDPTNQPLPLASFELDLAFCPSITFTLSYPPSPSQGEGTGEGVKALKPPVSWPPHPRPLPQRGEGIFGEGDLQSYFPNATLVFLRISRPRIESCWLGPFTLSCSNSSGVRYPRALWGRTASSPLRHATMIRRASARRLSVFCPVTRRSSMKSIVHD